MCLATVLPLHKHKHGLLWVTAGGFAIGVYHELVLTLTDLAVLVESFVLRHSICEDSALFVLSQKVTIAISKV